MIDINVGLIPNDGLGDTLRDAMIIVNNNFDELQGLINLGATQAELDAAVLLLQASIDDIYDILATKSNVGHTHIISDITGLQSALNALVSTTDFNTAISNINLILSQINNDIDTIENSIDSIGASISNIYTEITNLQTEDGILQDQIDDLSDNFIPLTGTSVGNGVTGPIEITGGNKIYADDGTSTSSIIFDASTVNIESFVNDNSSYASVAVTNDKIIVQTTDADNNPTRGITGNFDFSENLTDLDYTQKKYVDDAIAAATASIPAPTTPTLQQVVVAGNSTTNGIGIADGGLNGIYLYPSSISLGMNDGSTSLNGFINNSQFSISHTNVSNGQIFGSSYLTKDNFIVNVRNGISNEASFEVKPNITSIKSDAGEVTIGANNVSVSTTGPSGNKAYFETSALSTSRIFTFPNAAGTFSLVGHTHSISNISGLQAQLDLKANDNHVVHINGDEVIEGSKKFDQDLILNQKLSLLFDDNKFINIYADSDILKGTVDSLPLFEYQRGSFEFYNTSDFTAKIQNFGLTNSNQTYDLPNKSGTIALLSDITGGGATPSLQQVTDVGSSTDNDIYMLNGDNYIDLAVDFGYFGSYFESVISNTELTNDSNRIQLTADSSTQSSALTVLPGAINLKSKSFNLTGEYSNTAILSTDGYVGSGTYKFNFPEQSGTFSLTSDLASATASMSLQKVTSVGATTSNLVNLNGGIKTTRVYKPATSSSGVSGGGFDIGKPSNDYDELSFISNSDVDGLSFGYVQLSVSPFYGFNVYHQHTSSSNIAEIKIEPYYKKVRLYSYDGGNNSSVEVFNGGVEIVGATTSTNKRARLTTNLIDGFTIRDFQFPNASGILPAFGTTAPSSATESGAVGEIRVTSTFVYMCIATDTWVRSAMATW